jgi:hypothetical protein
MTDPVRPLETEIPPAAAGIERAVFPYMLCLAVVLCVVCCALILLIPTQSISVDTVYKGF